MPRLDRCLLVLLIGLTAFAAERDAASLRLVPFPKEATLAGGGFDLTLPLVLQAPKTTPFSMVQQALSTLQAAGIHRLSVAMPDGEGLALRIGRAAAAKPPTATFRAGATEEDYALTVSPDAIGIVGKGTPGLFYGLQTLRQLIRANQSDGKIPCLTLRDWPSLRWRCFQDDLTRGPSTKLDVLKRDLALGAFLKMNLWTYYMEYQYAWTKHPILGPKDGSLTPEELKALVAHGKPRHMGILGNQQSFGHFGRLLKHDKYKHLRESGSILSPVNDESYRFLDDLYSEVIPHLPLPFFNVCCDETWGLGKGPSKTLAKEIGVGGVYARHLRRVHDLLKDKYGKRMMMWGDIILQHPQHLEEIPKDTIMLTWGYGAAPSFEHQIVPFAKSGYEFFVCPGTSCWSRILPDFGVAMTNIRNFVRDGAKHGALGMLNTAWDDDGESLNAPNWHGYAWGAECAWNASKTSPEDFNRRIGAVLFGEKGDHFGQAIALLAQTHRLPGMHGMNNRRFWQDDLASLRTSAIMEAAAARKLLAIVQPAIEHLAACRKDATANAHLLDYFLFGARRMGLIGQRTLDRLAACTAYQAAYEGPLEQAGPLLTKAGELMERNRGAHEALGKRFAELWRRENKPYALDWTMRRYESVVARYRKRATRLDTIHRAVAAGKPVPSPGDVGLGIVELGVRRTRPHKVVQQPMAPNAPWAEPKATHRIALVVSAGKADRFDLPVELDLRLPDGLAKSRMRVIRTDGELPADVLAQLERADKPGQARLVMMLSGALTRGKSATIHVYLGLPMDEPGPPPPGAALTRDAPKGAKWLENDKLRLLLGPEGAHLYRWEVKALGNRDLTMPGETSYFGFADAGGSHRGSANKLVCSAHGPALVRYVCTDEHGLVKTVSLWGGASWAEITLNTPLWYFWALDHPPNFAADGPTPGRFLFSTGAKGEVGRQADGVKAQVKAPGAHWGIKFVPGKLALGMVTPEAKPVHVVAPGGGAGGVGIEGGAASHFVIYGGALTEKPEDVMNRLQRTLDFGNPPEVTLYAIQVRP